jgi:hypothetical protein
MSQRTQWHATRSHEGHVMDPRDPFTRNRDPRDPGLLGGPVRYEELYRKGCFPSR